MLRRPGGTPARSASRPIAIADSGVCAAGLSTTAHPAASAGPILRVIIALGKFHGVKIGRAHVCTPVTNAHLVCRLLLAKKKKVDKLQKMNKFELSLRHNIKSYFATLGNQLTILQ